MTNTHSQSAGTNPRALAQPQPPPHWHVLGESIHRQIRDLIHAYTTGTFAGENQAVEKLAVRMGFGPHDLAICDIRFGKQSATLLVVPYQGRRREQLMPKLLELRRQARASGHKAILVPQSAIERHPRLGNASLLGAVALRVQVDTTARMVVLEHLLEHGDCCISELAGLIAHPDPYGAILHLAAVGALTIDLRRIISPTTLIGLPSPFFKGIEQ